MIEVGADLGMAYDGDADRVGVIDERGRRHEADLILALLARDLLTRHPGAKIVFDVKSSQALVDDIRAHGGVPVMWKTGHSHLKRKMREDGILLGGEVSGHMFFAENYYGVDDGILASCKIIEIAARAAGAGLPPLRLGAPPARHARAEGALPDGEKFRVVDELARELKQRYETIDIDGARVLFPGRGWGLVRASNTNPYLTLRFEARTDAEIEEMKRVIYGALRPLSLRDAPDDERAGPGQPARVASAPGQRQADGAQHVGRGVAVAGAPVAGRDRAGSGGSSRPGRPARRSSRGPPRRPPPRR